MAKTDSKAAAKPDAKDTAQAAAQDTAQDTAAEFAQQTGYVDAATLAPGLGAQLTEAVAAAQAAQAADATEAAPAARFTDLFPPRARLTPVHGRAMVHPFAHLTIPVEGVEVDATETIFDGWLRVQYEAGKVSITPVDD